MRQCKCGGVVRQWDVKAGEQWECAQCGRRDLCLLQESQIISDHLYCMAMRLTDAGAKGVDNLIKDACKALGVDYPPEQIKANQQPVNAGI